MKRNPLDPLAVSNRCGGQVLGPGSDGKDLAHLTDIEDFPS